MDSKLFITIVVLMTICATFAMPDDDTESKDVTHEDMQKLLSAMEKIDIDQILNNTRLMMNNIKCFLNEGPCSAQIKDMKSEYNIKTKMINKI